MRSEPRRLSQLELVCPLAALPFLIFPSVLSALALVFLLAPWALRWRIYGRPTARTPMDVPILCLLFMVPVSLWASALPEVSLPKLLGILLGVAFFYSVVNSVRSNEGGGALARVLPVSVAALLAVWTSNPGVEAGAITTVYPIASPALRTPWA